MTLTIVYGILGLGIVGIAVLIAFALNLWLLAFLSGCPVGMLHLIGMRFRKVDPKVIVLSRIRLHKAGIKRSAGDLEVHSLAGGRVGHVVQALVVAKRNGQQMSWESACAVDLAGRDILQAVQRPLRAWEVDIDSVAGDGVRLVGQARVTLEVILDRLVGGLPEEGVIELIRQAIAYVIEREVDHANLTSDWDRFVDSVYDAIPPRPCAFKAVSIEIESLRAGT